MSPSVPPRSDRQTSSDEPPTRRASCVLSDGDLDLDMGLGLPAPAAADLPTSAKQDTESQRAAAQRKSAQPNELPQPRGPMPTPQEFSKTEYERDLQMGEVNRQHRQKMLEAQQQRNAQMLRAQQGVQYGSVEPSSLQPRTPWEPQVFDGAAAVDWMEDDIVLDQHIESHDEPFKVPDTGKDGDDEEPFIFQRDDILSGSPVPAKTSPGRFETVSRDIKQLPGGQGLHSSPQRKHTIPGGEAPPPPMIIREGRLEPYIIKEERREPHQIIFQRDEPDFDKEVREEDQSLVRREEPSPTVPFYNLPPMSISYYGPQYRSESRSSSREPRYRRERRRSEPPPPIVESESDGDEALSKGEIDQEPIIQEVPELVGVQRPGLTSEDEKEPRGRSKRPSNLSPDMSDVAPEFQRRAPSTYAYSRSTEDTDLCAFLFPASGVRSRRGHQPPVTSLTSSPRRRRSKSWRAPKQAGRKRVDANQPLSAYEFFANEQRERVRKDNPGVKFREVVKKLSENWNALSDKQRERYYAKAKADKQRYEKGKATYAAGNDKAISSTALRRFGCCRNCDCTTTVEWTTGPDGNGELWLCDACSLHHTEPISEEENEQNGRPASHKPQSYDAVSDSETSQEAQEERTKLYGHHLSSRESSVIADQSNGFNLREYTLDIAPPPSQRGWDRIKDLGRSCSTRDPVPHSPSQEGRDRDGSRGRPPANRDRCYFSPRKSSADRFRTPAVRHGHEPRRHERKLSPTEHRDLSVSGSNRKDRHRTQGSNESFDVRPPWNSECTPLDLQDSEREDSNIRISGAAKDDGHRHHHRRDSERDDKEDSDNSVSGAAKIASGGLGAAATLFGRLPNEDDEGPNSPVADRGTFQSAIGFAGLSFNPLPIARSSRATNDSLPRISTSQQNGDDMVAVTLEDGPAFFSPGTADEEDTQPLTDSSHFRPSALAAPSTPEIKEIRKIKEEREREEREEQERRNLASTLEIPKRHRRRSTSSEDDPPTHRPRDAIPEASRGLGFSFEGSDESILPPLPLPLPPPPPTTDNQPLTSATYIPGSDFYGPGVGIPILAHPDSTDFTPRKDEQGPSRASTMSNHNVLDFVALEELESRRGSRALVRPHLEAFPSDQASSGPSADISRPNRRPRLDHSDNADTGSTPGKAISGSDVADGDRTVNEGGAGIDHDDAAGDTSAVQALLARWLDSSASALLLRHGGTATQT